MKSQPDIFDLIDKFILNELNEEELALFEKKLETDPEFAREVKETQELISLMEESDKELKLREQLSELHKPKSYTKQKAVKRSLWPTIGIAASFSIIATISSLFIMGYFKEKKVHNVYPVQQLSNEITDIQKKQDDLMQKVDDLEKSTTPITSRNGTCFPITHQGHLVTNYHVVRGAKKIRISTESEEYFARVAYKDHKIDVAILEITDTSFTGFQNIPYTLSNRELRLSEPIYTMGYPKKDIVYGEGAVTSKTGYKSDTTMFQVSIPVNPGNSGSPVFDKQGHIIGLIKSKNIENEGTSYVLKSEYFSSLIDSLESNEQDPYQLPSKNRIKWKKKPDQVEILVPYIFRIVVSK